MASSIKILFLLLLTSSVSAQHGMFYSVYGSEPNCKDTVEYFNTTPTVSTFYWTCPVGVYKATFTLVGAGGSGGYSTGERGAGGGGGGAYLETTLDVVPERIYKMGLGRGGEGGLSTAEDGEPTIIYSDGLNVWINAVGGKKGDYSGAGDNGHGGLGGDKNDCIIDGVVIAKTSGGRGGNGYDGAGSYCAGTGGFSGNHNGDGINGTDNFLCYNSDGDNGSQVGMGGGGGMSTDDGDHSGGNGADGFVSISYCKPIN